MNGGLNNDSFLLGKEKEGGGVRGAGSQRGLGEI